MMPHRLLVVGRLAAGLLVAVASSAEAGEFVVDVPPGPLGRAFSEAFVAPFTQAAGSAPAAPAPADPAPPAHPDALLLDGQALLAGCKTGMFQKLDWGAIGGRDRLVAQAASDCGVGAVLRATVLAWSRDKFTGAPTWAEFWDVAKVPGKRGLRRGARGNLEFALIADGISPGDVYATLREAAGVERAFRKLDQLKPYVVWWQTEEEAPRLLASGDVLMTSAPADGVLAAAKATSGVAPRDFAVQWIGALISIDSVALPAAAAPSALQARFLAFVTDPKQQGRLGPFSGFGSAVNGGTDSLGPAEKAQSPATPANLSVGLIADESFWRDNGAKLDKLFEAWLAKP